jgi:phosphopantetheinyl transferase
MEREPRTHPDVVARFARTRGLDDFVLSSQAGEARGPGELDIPGSLRLRETRRESLAARILARTVAAQLAGTPVSRVHLRSTRRGVPRVELPPGGADLRVSLSHAEGIVLCAIARGLDVGADVESLRNVGPDPLAVADGTCSDRERRLLVTTPAQERSREFLTYWTGKEAVAKALGLGFRLSPSWIEVFPSRTPGNPPSRGVGEIRGDPRVWSLSWHPVPPTHLACVAVEGRHGQVPVIGFREQDLRGPPEDGTR